MTSAPTIGAIETTYQGIRFRSRLEARWAVFFDAAGWAWEHEPEGYTDGTTRYLPDFWLSDRDCFWEVKPYAWSLSEQAFTQAFVKAEMLARLTAKDVCIAFDFPQQTNDPARFLIISPNGSDVVMHARDFGGDFLDAAAKARRYRFWNPS